MASVRAQQAQRNFTIHDEEQVEDEDQYGTQSEDGEGHDVKTPDEDIRDDTESEVSDESEETVHPLVLDDIRNFEATFKGINERFRLINRIGEGTFSTVYKAEDLLYEHYNNEWDIEEKENSKWVSPPLKSRSLDRVPAHGGGNAYEEQRRRPKYVAIKKIYVTSSPSRILNELELLHDLRNCDSVCPLITAFRHTDQVVAVLPYFRHQDFRDYYRDMSVVDMQIYFRSLFKALAAVHEKGILHRDIKPTNFLYEPDKRRGVLVDFGLAEREFQDKKPCLCTQSKEARRAKIESSVAARSGPSIGYPKADSRPSKRANRAGTRGFRAPEVLFKCTDQTTQIDIWSAGVMLLTILSRRFPFFNSADDVEATIEIATLFGSRKMKAAALLHGCVFETNIPTIGASGHPLETIILWSTCRNENAKTVKSYKLTDEEVRAIKFLNSCLELDPKHRITAREALRHPFLANIIEDDEEEELEEADEMQLVQ